MRDSGWGQAGGVGGGGGVGRREETETSWEEGSGTDSGLRDHVTTSVESSCRSQAVPIVRVDGPFRFDGRRRERGGGRGKGRGRGEGGGSKSVDLAAPLALGRGEGGTIPPNWHKSTHLHTIRYKTL